MKIVHICLVGPYSDGFSYQENIIAKYHRRSGNEVTIIASINSWDKDGRLIQKKESTYYNEDGVKIIRLSENKTFFSKLKSYCNFYNTLIEEKPDIIFSHGCNYEDIDNIYKYKINNNSCTLFFDNHCDSTNSGTNFISKYILHRFIWRNKIKKLIPLTKMFYGVLPKRCEYLYTEYNIPLNKIKLLVMGVDDDYIGEDLSFSLKNNYFELSIGGKIDEWKAQEIIKFLKAYELLSFSTNLKSHITIYGSIVDKYKNEILKFSERDDIDYFGWANQKEIVEIIKKSNYAIFPGRHSVLWEEAVGLGTPIVVKRIEGYNHIDIGGNVVFLEKQDIEYYKKIILTILNEKFYKEIKSKAMTPKRNMFLYSKISKEAIDG